MSKAIRITAIIALVTRILHVIVGKLLIPGIGIFFLNRQHLPANMILRVFPIYYGIETVYILLDIIFLVTAVVIIITANSRSTNIVFEIIAYILMIIVLPIVSMLISSLCVILVSRTTMMNLTIFTEMSAISNWVDAIASLSYPLLYISMAISICRKKTQVALDSYQD